MTAEDVHVRLDGVVKRFGATTAVAGISLDVHRGSLTTVLGPSGCGKTTLLRLIAGFLEPDAGEVLIDGVSQRGLPPYRRATSTVFQEYALFPHMTVFENVAYGLRLRRFPRARVAEQVGRTLGLMRLEGLEGRLPRELSGGQQQRVALARSLVVEPAVLLMDEPLSNLDARLRVSVRTEIREVQQRLQITTLYVTHDQEEALAISDRIAVMRRGRLAQVGPPQEIYERPVDPFVAAFVGEVNLLRATVEPGHADGRPRLRIGPLALPLPTDAPPLVLGEEVIVALRPEVIRLGGPAGGPDGFAGRVVSQTYLGTTVRYRVALDGGPILLVDDSDPAGKPLRRGAVTLSFDPRRAQLWPASPAALAQLTEPAGA